MGAVAQKPKNRLPDGRTVRPLPGTFTQEQMFGLHKSGLFDPAVERIMDVKDHDDALNKSGAWKSINVNGRWRTNRFAAYRCDAGWPIGDKLVYVEDGIARTIEIPDVPVAIVRPDGKSEIIGLRQAIGMLDFALEKLQYDPEARIVSVTSDFNPETDVRVVDVMRPRNWALVDADGYPIRSKPSKSRVKKARYSYVKHWREFEDGSTGFGGSVGRGVDGYGDVRRGVGALDRWSYESGVAVATLLLVSSSGSGAPQCESTD